MKPIKYEAPVARDLAALSVRGDIDVLCLPGFIAQDNPPPSGCLYGGSADTECSQGYFYADPNLCTTGSSAGRDCVTGGAAGNPVCTSGIAVT